MLSSITNDNLVFVRLIKTVEEQSGQVVEPVGNDLYFAKLVNNKNDINNNTMRIPIQNNRNKYKSLKFFGSVITCVAFSVVLWAGLITLTLVL